MRLCKRREFLQFSNPQANPLNYLGETLLISFLSSDTLKLGITVSKQHGNAPTRNRIKRLIREGFRLLQHQLTIGSYHVRLKKGSSITFNKVIIDFEHFQSNDYHST